MWRALAKVQGQRKAACLNIYCTLRTGAKKTEKEGGGQEGRMRDREKPRYPEGA